jgi:hypothetical protein
MAPPWEMPKPKRRLPGGLTGNALLTAVIAAVVSGVPRTITRWLPAAGSSSRDTEPAP